MKKGEHNVKVKFMAITVVLALVLSLVLALAGPVSAFPVYDVSGTWNVNLEYLSVNYAETLVLTQTGGNITGVSLDSIPPVASSAFTITGGSVSGNAIVFHASYNPNNLKTMTFTGTIANSGSMSGTWVDDPGFLDRTGTWAATKNTGGTIGVTGEWVGPTINFTAPGSAINLGQLYVNTTTPWGYTGTAGTVSFLPGSDTNGALALAISSTPYGQMQNQNDSSYLPNNLSVALGTELSSIASNVDTDGTTAWVYGDLPAGPAAFAVPTTGVSYSFDVAARQVMGAAIPSAGSYMIVINVVAGYTP